MNYSFLSCASLTMNSESISASGRYAASKMAPKDPHLLASTPCGAPSQDTRVGLCDQQQAAEWWWHSKLLLRLLYKTLQFPSWALALLDRSGSSQLPQQEDTRVARVENSGLWPAASKEIRPADTMWVRLKTGFPNEDTTSWETLSQNHPAKPFPHSDPQKLSPYDTFAVFTVLSPTFLVICYVAIDN